MFAHPTIEGRLRGLASTVLIANDIYWEDPEVSPNTIGNNVYKGINTDNDYHIRQTWTKLAEVRIKEITDKYSPKGTSVLWGLFYSIEIGSEGRPVQHAYFIQLSHRQDEKKTEEYLDPHPGDIH